MQSVTGSITRILYVSGTRPFSIFIIAPCNGGDFLRILTRSAGWAIGAQVVCEGSWEEDPRYGAQFRAQECCLLTHFGKDALAVIEELRHANIPLGLSRKLYHHYHEAALSVVRANPYQVVHQIDGVGFKTMDKLARKWKLPKSDERRIQAALLAILRDNEKEGHVWVPLPSLLALAEKLLGIDRTLIVIALDVLQDLQLLVEEDAWVARFSLATGEKLVAQQLAALIKNKPARVDGKEYITDGWLSAEQIEAVTALESERVLIVSGGAGTGKSSLLKAVLEMGDGLGWKVLLSTPTGKAAKRVEKLTGACASTIHRLLEIDRSGVAKKNRENPLDVDLLVIDEMSMVDLPLFKLVLEALPAHSRLLLLGDAAQLPSISPGSILQELIASQHVKTIYLTRVFRQEEGSSILALAAMVREQKVPKQWGDTHSDFYFISCRGVEEIVAKTQALVASLLEENRFVLDDIQIVTARRTGSLGSERFNQVIQTQFFLNAPRLEAEDRIFCLGDKVVQLSNRYDYSIMNGDTGKVTAVHSDGITVLFGDRSVLIGKERLGEIELAYALSVHKSQGDEFPCLLFVVDMSHYPFLSPALIYTAITRAKKLYIIGSKKAFAIGIKKTAAQDRLSKLACYLQCFCQSC